VTRDVAIGEVGRVERNEYVRRCNVQRPHGYKIER